MVSKLRTGECRSIEIFVLLWLSLFFEIWWTNEENGIYCDKNIVSEHIENILSPCYNAGSSFNQSNDRMHNYMYRWEKKPYHHVKDLPKVYNEPLKNRLILIKTIETTKS